MTILSQARHGRHGESGGRGSESDHGDVVFWAVADAAAQRWGREVSGWSAVVEIGSGGIGQRRKKEPNSFSAFSYLDFSSK